MDGFIKRLRLVLPLFSLVLIKASTCLAQDIVWFNEYELHNDLMSLSEDAKRGTRSIPANSNLSAVAVIGAIDFWGEGVDFEIDFNPLELSISVDRDDSISPQLPMFLVKTTPLKAGNINASFKLKNGSGVVAHTITLTVRGLLPGDATGDSCVTLSDFSTLKGNFGKALPISLWKTPQIFGDFNADGTCDLGDFAILKSNFGLCG